MPWADGAGRQPVGDDVETPGTANTWDVASGTATGTVDKQTAAAESRTAGPEP